MEHAGGLLSPPIPWGDEGALMQRLQLHLLLQLLRLGASGGPAGVNQQRLWPVQNEVERAGLSCESLKSLKFTLVLCYQSVTDFHVFLLF